MGKRIRASMLPAYNDCPRRAIARQFREEIESFGYQLNKSLPSIGAAVGTATHKAIELYFQSKLSGNILHSEPNAHEEAMSGLKEEIKSGVLWDDTTTNIETASKQVWRMTNIYIESIGKDINPIATEVPVLAEYEDWELSGTIDLVAEDGDGVRIVDFKTGKAVRSFHTQTGAYSLLYRTVNPEQKVNSIAIDFIKRTPGRNPQEMPISKIYDVGLCEKVAWVTILKIKRDFEEFEKSGDPFVFSENPMSMLCNEKYCPCFNTDFCPITKNKTVEVKING